YWSSYHQEPQSCTSGINRRRSCYSTCRKTTRLNKQFPLPVATRFIGGFDISNPTAEFDDRQAIAEDSCMLGKPYQIVRLNLTGDVELDDAAAAVGNVGSAVPAGEWCTAL